MTSNQETNMDTDTSNTQSPPSDDATTYAPRYYHHIHGNEQWVPFDGDEVAIHNYELLQLVQNLHHEREYDEEQEQERQEDEDRQEDERSWDQKLNLNQKESGLEITGPGLD